MREESATDLPPPRSERDRSPLYDFALYAILLALVVAVVVEVAFYGSRLLLPHVIAPVCAP
jgi:hypothetical protein